MKTMVGKTKIENSQDKIDFVQKINKRYKPLAISLKKTIKNRLSISIIKEGTTTNFTDIKITIKGILLTTICQ